VRVEADMTGHDLRLRALRGQAREWGRELRAHGFAAENDPGLVRQLDLAALRYLATTPVPPEYGAPPMRIDGHCFDGTSVLERVVVIEELACGDAGLLVAAPGPSMAGILIDQLADEAQKQWFYDRITQRPTWTFFALTEPASGSDAAAVATSVTRLATGPGYRLDGLKRYIGNAARADIGVVFARTAPGPAGITAVLTETSPAGLRAMPIPTIGLRALQLCEVTFDGVVIPPGRLLGQHLSPTRRGLAAGIRVFNMMRPGVAAIALGIARAAQEYAAAHRRDLDRAGRDRLDQLKFRIEGTRRLICAAAEAADADPSAGYLSSAAKDRAGRLAEDATLAALSCFGSGAAFEHPLLDKLARDARGVEFMEGTGHMQKLNLAHGLLTGRVPREPMPRES
jgi:acyl-CoA dehydrogenase